MKKFDEAESLLVNSLRMLKEKYHRENKYTQKALKSLIELYEGRNEPDKAEKYHKLLKEEIETP